MQYDTSKLTPTVAEREEALRVHDARDTAEAAYEAAAERPETEVSNEELGRLDRAAKAAQDALNMHPITFLEHDDGSVRRCSVSGVPLVDGDELMATLNDDSDELLEAALRLVVLGDGEAKQAQAEAA